MKYLKYCIFFGITTLMINIINMWNFDKGQSGVTNILASVGFLFALFMFSAKIGKDNDKSFVLFSLVYYIIGAFVGRLMIIIPFSFVPEFLVKVYRMPIYGIEIIYDTILIRFLLRVVFDYIVIFVLPMLVIIIGFLYANQVKKKLAN